MWPVPSPCWQEFAPIPAAAMLCQDKETLFICELRNGQFNVNVAKGTGAAGEMIAAPMAFETPSLVKQPFPKRSAP
jgi:hypothetical protein